jgi:hypothetical protein
MDDRRKALERIAKELQATGNINTSGLIDTKQPLIHQALDARDLTQSALAKKVLDNTGIPIPSPNARSSKLEDFYNRIGQEAYPELKKVDVNLADLSKEGARGAYYGGDKLKWIEMQKGLYKQNPESAVGTLLHELGHQYDDEILGKRGNPINDKFRSSGMSPEDAYELIANKHHVDYIPGKREVGTYGKGALQSLLKNGTFKTIAGALPLAGTAMALSSGDANAAAAELPSEIPGVGQVYDAIRSENAGSAQDDKQMIAERNAAVNYGKSPAGQAAEARRKAIGMIAKGNIDLAHRPVVKNPDGSISTVRSMSVNFGDGETLLPTVSDDGRVVEPNEAIDMYKQTGRHLGKFQSPEQATNYAENLHNDQARMYENPAENSDLELKKETLKRLGK